MDAAILFVSVMAMLAGVAAAWLAHAVRDEQRAASALAEQRRIEDLRPRPFPHHATQRGPATVDVVYSNAGGPAHPWLLYLASEGCLFFLRSDVPRDHTMTAFAPITLNAIGALAAEDRGRRILLSLAKDRDGLWWDVSAGERLGQDLSREVVAQRLVANNVAPDDAARVMDQMEH